ncbi:MAG: hypothetical protein QHH75_08445 [Bacillota bacterium]|nr:hypothetical protein [Bacillota bacterium]
MIYPIQDLLDDRGSALLLTILAVGMLSVLALGLASITMADNTATVQSLGEAKARYAAEAGVNRALYEIRNYLETGISPASSYQDSLEPDLNYNVSLDRIPNTDLFQINAKGTYKNFSGEIKAKADTLPKAADYAIFTDQDLNLGTVAEFTIRGDIHSNGKIHTGGLTDILLDNFKLEGEAYTVDDQNSCVPKHVIQKGENIPFPELDWDKIKQKATLKNPSSIPDILFLDDLLKSILNVWIFPRLHGESAYFEGNVLLIGPFTGKGVLAVKGTAIALLSGASYTPTPNEGIMLAAKDDLIFLLSIADLGNVLKTVLGLVGDLLDFLLGWLTELPELGLPWQPNYYLNGLVYSGGNIVGLANIPTVKGAVVTRNFSGLELSSLIVHDPELASKLPARKIFFKDNPVRIVSWEEN